MPPTSTFSIIQLSNSRARKIAGFLCYGMAGFINESHSENTPSEMIQQEADQLLKALLTSDVLIQS